MSPAAACCRPPPPPCAHLAPPLTPQAAGVIHGDFERGFIRAETVSYDEVRFVSLSPFGASRDRPRTDRPAPALRVANGRRSSERERERKREREKERKREREKARERERSRRRGGALVTHHQLRENTSRKSASRNNTSRKHESRENTSRERRRVEGRHASATESQTSPRASGDGVVRIVAAFSWRPRSVHETR